MRASFLWHDYETFGANVRVDRPAEFACWRSNEAFEPISEPVAFRCRPTLDYLPQPQACVITGIGPESAWREGLTEPEFAERDADLRSRTAEDQLSLLASGPGCVGSGGRPRTAPGPICGAQRPRLFMLPRGERIDAAGLPAFLTPVAEDRAGLCD